MENAQFKKFGQFIFQDLESDERLVVVLRLLLPKPYSESKTWSYNVWCAIIEVMPNAPPNTPMLDSIRQALALKPTLWLENREYVATSALGSGIIAQATLVLDDFLGRKEFTLTLEFFKADEAVWKGLREKRIGIFKANDDGEESQTFVGIRDRIGRTERFRLSHFEVDVRCSSRQAEKPKGFSRSV